MKCASQYPPSLHHLSFTPPHRTSRPSLLNSFLFLFKPQTPFSKHTIIKHKTLSLMEDHHHHHHHHGLPPFPSSTAAAGILLSPPQNSLLPILPQPPFGLISSIPPQSYYYTNPHPTPPPPSSHFPPAFLSYAVGNNNKNNNNDALPKENEGRRVLDAWSTKVARSKRRLARQRSLTSPRTSSSSANFDEYSKGQTTTHFPNFHPQPNNKAQTLFTFFTPEKKILKLLLKKELKNSDVGSLGRIVLPKREAEDNLPLLTDKEGMQVVIRDVNSNRKWAMKYKYWANNRSRMYVLENTGDFVRQNGLLMGDTMTLYEDDCKNLYVSVERGENYQNSRMEENYEQMRKQQQQQQCAAAAGARAGGSNCYTTNNIDIIKDEEEEASLALLIEELKHKTTEDHLIQHHHQQNNNLILLSQNSDSSYYERGTSSCNSYNSYNNYNYNYNNHGKNNESAGGGEDLQANGFEDCFGGLDTLPEVSGFKFPLFDYLSNDRTT